MVKEPGGTTPSVSALSSVAPTRLPAKVTDEAYVGGGHSLAPGVSFMCKLCAEEYYRFLVEKWPGFGDAEITDEQATNIHRTDKAAVLGGAEEHMKKWVAERKSK